MQVWDAIVVGAGPAGCSCAYDLAAAGKTVLLLDKAAFPRVKACAGGLTAKTVRALRYSVDAVVRQSIGRILLETRESLTIPVRSRNPICVMTVRAELDAYCLAKTIEAGAVFQRIRGIESISEDGGRVFLKTQDAIFQSSFLIGADGANSQVRRYTGDAGWFRKGLAIETNVPRDARHDDLVFDFAPVASGYGWIFPKRDHVNVGLYSAYSGEALQRRHLSAYIAKRFGDGAKTENFIGQYIGFGAAQHRSPQSRVFLVGDAGGFADVLTGEGIYGAIVSGQAAAAAILASLDRHADAAEEFAARTAEIREGLRVVDRAATSFYRDPEPAFRVMKMPALKTAVLKSYAQGFQLPGLMKLARRIARPVARAAAMG